MSRSDFRFISWWSVVIIIALIATGFIAGWGSLGIALISMFAGIMVVVAGVFFVAGINHLIDFVYDRWIRK